MANKWAIANGTWDTPSIWNDGIVPSVGDTVYANGKTVKFNNNINIGDGWLRNDANAELGVVAGGLFSSTSGANTEEVTANIYGCNNVVCLYLGTTNVKTVNGNLESDETGAVVRFDSSSYSNNAGKLVINGNLSGRIDFDTYIDSSMVTIHINGNWEAYSNGYILNKIRTNWYADSGVFIEIMGVFHVFNNTVKVLSNVGGTTFFIITLFNKVIIDSYLQSVVTSNLRIIGNVVDTYMLLNSTRGFVVQFYSISKDTVLYDTNGDVLMEGVNVVNYPPEDKVAVGVRYGSRNQYVGRMNELSVDELNRIKNCATVSTVQKCFEDFKE